MTDRFDELSLLIYNECSNRMGFDIAKCAEILREDAAKEIRRQDESFGN